MTEMPVLIRAREKLIASHEWSEVVETGIRSGSWDRGSLIGDFLNEAEQELIREQAEEIADD